MMTMKTLLQTRSLISLGLTLCLTCVTAHAQMGGMGGGGRGGSPGPGHEAAAGAPGEGFVNPTARLNQFADQLVALRLRLQLEGAQNAAWNSFQRKASDWAADVYRSRYASTEETALQALERRASDAHRRQALLDALLAAARPLEALLRPEQRSQFDQQLPSLLP